MLALPVSVVVRLGHLQLGGLRRRVMGRAVQGLFPVHLPLLHSLGGNGQLKVNLSTWGSQRISHQGAARWCGCQGGLLLGLPTFSPNEVRYTNTERGIMPP